MRNCTEFKLRRIVGREEDMISAADKFVHRRHHCALLLLFFSLCDLTAPLRADDWPQWRGPTRTGHVAPDTRLLRELPREPRLVWRVPIGEGFASPVVVGGKVFYFD